MRTTKLQKSIDFSGQKFYLGLDVHKKSWSVTVRSLNLHLEHFTQPPSPSGLLAHLKHRFPGGHYYSAYEAGFCGTGIHESYANWVLIISLFILAIFHPPTKRIKTKLTYMTAALLPITWKEAIFMEFM